MGCEATLQLQLQEPQNHTSHNTQASPSHSCCFVPELPPNKQDRPLHTTNSFNTPYTTTLTRQEQTAHPSHPRTQQHNAAATKCPVTCPLMTLVTCCECCDAVACCWLLPLACALAHTQAWLHRRLLLSLLSPSLLTPLPPSALLPSKQQQTQQHHP